EGGVQPVLADRGDEVVAGLVLDQVGGETGVEGVRGVHADAGDAQVDAHGQSAVPATAQARQEVAGADVGDEPDRRLGHGHHDLLGDHPVRAVDGDPQAAAHGHAVDHGDGGRAVRVVREVHRVLLVEERPVGLVVAGGRGIAQGTDV